MSKTPHHYSAKALAGTLMNPNTRDKAEEWLLGLGVGFVDVEMLRPDGTWRHERLVDDELTLDETIPWAMNRAGALYALRAYHGKWELRRAGRGIRYFDTREAAEMVALHNG